MNPRCPVPPAHYLLPDRTWSQESRLAFFKRCTKGQPLALEPFSVPKRHAQEGPRRAVTEIGANVYYLRYHLTPNNLSHFATGVNRRDLFDVRWCLDGSDTVEETDQSKARTLETITSFDDLWHDWLEDVKASALQAQSEVERGLWYRPIGAAGDREPFSESMLAQLTGMPPTPYQDTTNCLPKALFSLLHQHPRLHLNSKVRCAILRKTTKGMSMMVHTQHKNQNKH